MKIKNLEEFRKKYKKEEIEKINLYKIDNDNNEIINKIISESEKEIERLSRLKDMNKIIIKNDELFDRIDFYDDYYDDYIYNMMKSDLSDEEKKEKIFSFLNNDFEFLSDKLDRIFKLLNMKFKFFYKNEEDLSIIFYIERIQISESELEIEFLKDDIYEIFQEEFDFEDTIFDDHLEYISFSESDKSFL